MIASPSGMTVPPTSRSVTAYRNSTCGTGGAHRNASSTASDHDATPTRTNSRCSGWVNSASTRLCTRLSVVSNPAPSINNRVSCSSSSLRGWSPSAGAPCSRVLVRSSAGSRRFSSTISRNNTSSRARSRAACSDDTVVWKRLSTHSRNVVHPARRRPKSWAITEIGSGLASSARRSTTSEAGLAARRTIRSAVTCSTRGRSAWTRRGRKAALTIRRSRPCSGP